MKCVNTTLLNKYYEDIEYRERMQDNFLSDIEPMLLEISEQAQKIKDIESNYPSFDFEDLIKECIEEVL